ncbi:HNH endonuclease [Nocardia mangyaensis]|uniref:HNH endonuclease n=1 Tax=Nocardia mangyaensis TaxID=2213200 RepID=UPI000A036508|nr:HNH endonuclease [Nocardia mangyaensis]
MDLEDEWALRRDIFDVLRELVDARGGAVTRADLLEFRAGTYAIQLVDRNRGIRNPQVLASTLSIMSKPDSPYADEEVGDSLFSYAYREGPIDAGDNVKLRRSALTKLPLILLRWIKVGTEIRYLPVFPVYVVADDPANRRVLIALDESLRQVSDPQHLTETERRYVQRMTSQRLHQPQFRSRVLMAYGNRCAVCRLGRPQLLEAAHIIGDKKAHGIADIPNGLSLCSIHHAAYDRNMIGISPDYRVHIGPTLAEADNEGPILEFGFKGLNNVLLTLPDKKRFHPAGDRLAERFQEFLTGTTHAHPTAPGAIKPDFQRITPVTMGTDLGATVFEPPFTDSPATQSP